MPGHSLIEAAFSSGDRSATLQLHVEDSHMTFAVEQIPEEARVGFLANHKLYQSPRAVTLNSRWVVDLERDAMLVFTGSVGGSYEGTQVTMFYSLYWNDEQISLSADPLITRNSKSGLEVTWLVHQVNIPSSLDKHAYTIYELLTDAFRTVGDGHFNGSTYATVNAEFVTSIAHRIRYPLTNEQKASIDYIKEMQKSLINEVRSLKALLKH